MIIYDIVGWVVNPGHHFQLSLAKKMDDMSNMQTIKLDDMSNFTYLDLDFMSNFKKGPKIRHIVQSDPSIILEAPGRLCLGWFYTPYHIFSIGIWIELLKEYLHNC